MNINLTPIIQAVLALLAALITYRLVPWIKARTTGAQREQLQAAIRIAVFAAEQIFGAGHGAEKMDYAIKYLRDKGWDVDPREVEAEVYDLINKFEDMFEEGQEAQAEKPPDGDVK